MTAIAKVQSVASLANKLRHQPKLLADTVYGGREGTPWMQGSKYIGRGPTQCTHLDNYRAVGAEIAKQPGGAAVDLVANPRRPIQSSASARRSPSTANRLAPA